MVIHASVLWFKSLPFKESQWRAEREEKAPGIRLELAPEATTLIRAVSSSRSEHLKLAKGSELLLELRFNKRHNDKI